MAGPENANGFLGHLDIERKTAAHCSQELGDLSPCMKILTDSNRPPARERMILRP
jgi:hypothetical protein